MPIQMQATLLDSNNNSWKSGLIMDVSGAGIGILLEEEIKTGTRLLLEMDTGQATIRVYGKVIWARAMQGNESFRCAAGIKLTDINGRELNALLSCARSQIVMTEGP